MKNTKKHKNILLKVGYKLFCVFCQVFFEGKMKVELPRVFSDLLTKKARYKLYYGGRAGGKSYAFVDALLIKSTSKKMLIACVREVQSSIKDSVYKLIADRISYYGLREYRLYEDKIVNVNNNSKFIFKGIIA